MNILLTIVLFITAATYIPFRNVVNVLANKDRDKKKIRTDSSSSIRSIDSFHSARSHFSDRSSSSRSKYKTSLRRGNSLSGSFGRTSQGSIRYPVGRARSYLFDGSINVPIHNRWSHNKNGASSMEKHNFYLKYSGFSITPYLSKYHFSNRIYNNVWSISSYESFWKNNYEEFKSRVVANINLLRLAHRSVNVKRSDVLDKIAQAHANKMARMRTLFSENSEIYGIVVGMSYYPAASIIVTKWYDENHKYNFFLNRPQPGTQSFTQIIWKNENFIGVGVARSKDILFIACYFYPKGNIKNQYKRNVLRKRFNWYRIL